MQKKRRDYDQGNNKKICVLSLRAKVFTHWFFLVIFFTQTHSYMKYILHLSHQLEYFMWKFQKWFHVYIKSSKNKEQNVYLRLLK